MLASRMSSEPLSTPSSTPSPPPPRTKGSAAHKTQAAHMNNKQAVSPHGLNSDSELSELTEEEQENAEKRDHASNGPDGAAGDEESGGGTSGATSTNASKRGVNKQGGKRGGGRKKRSSLVPAPMWGWAEVRTSDVQEEEEEEEELTAQPKALEEEEDEEEGEGEKTADFADGVMDVNAPQAGPSVMNGTEEEEAESETEEGNKPSESDSDLRPFPPTRHTRRLGPFPPRAKMVRHRNTAGTRTEDEESDKDDGKEIVDADLPADNVDPLQMTPAADDNVPIITSATLKSTASPLKPTSRVGDHAGPPIASIGIITTVAASSIIADSLVFDPPSSSSTSRSQSPVAVEVTTKKSDDEDDGDDKPLGSTKPSKHISPPLNMDVDIPGTEGDADVEPSAEMDGEEVEIEPEQEVENEVEAEVEAEEPPPDDDLEVELESDLQPAHRAEALDVLATIELKFALLRERVYVEKMEGLAWEEKLLNDGTHPELIYIQKELLKRRDKRLELASCKREYELANVAKMRRVNEDSTWSWWKLARDELQADMIAETSRKRRRLERERRATERPQPVRRIPVPPSEVPPAPSLRKIVKTFPFGDKHKSHSSQSIQGVYPELSGLSSSEINADLEIFFSSQRYGFRGGGDPVLGFPVQVGPPTGFGGGGYDGPVDHMGNTMVGPSPSHPLPPPGSRMPMQQHVPPPLFAPPYLQPPHSGYGYPPAVAGNGRIPPPPSIHGHGPIPGHGHVQHGHGPPGSILPPTHGGPPSGSGMYPDELMPPSPHHYYGSQQPVNGGYAADGIIPPPPPPPPGPNVGPHGRRSTSPMNGITINGKQGFTGHGGHHHHGGQSGWIGPGMVPGAGSAPTAGASGSGGYSGQGRPPPPPPLVSVSMQKGEWAGDEGRREREYNVAFEEEERMMLLKGREHRGREMMMDRVDREREREREEKELKEREGDETPMDVDRVMDRERERERHIQQMMVHRQQGQSQGPPGHSSSSGPSGPPAPPGPPPPHSHLHSSMSSGHHMAIGGHHHPRAAPPSTSLPPPPPHHHHHHHHHVVHHHHGQSSGPPTSGGPGSDIHSPRILAREREYVEHEREREKEREKEGRPGSALEHGPYPTEVINLSSKQGLAQPPQHLGKDSEHGDSRDREREREQNERERARGGERMRLAQPQAQPHGLVPGSGMETDRLMKTSFVMASTQSMQGSMLNMNGASSPRVSSGYDAMYDRDRHGNGTVKSPSHRFSSAGPGGATGVGSGGRSVPTTVGSSTPCAVPTNVNHRERERERERLMVMSPPLASSRKTTTLSASPIHGGQEREREGERGVEKKSPHLQGVRTPVPVLTSGSTGTGPMKFGPLPLLGEREREQDRPSSLSLRSPSSGGGGGGGGVGKGLGPSPTLGGPRIGLLSGSGRAITPGATEGRNGGNSSTYSSPRGVNEVKMGMAGPGVLSSTSGSPTVGMAASSKMSVPQMVD